jgi:bifunctional non-homologous end joining protein LigD
VPSNGVQFVKPTLVVDVEYRRWPDDGLIQQAAFKGIRNDKEAKDVVKEHPTFSVR